MQYYEYESQLSYSLLLFAFVKLANFFWSYYRKAHQNQVLWVLDL